MDAPHGFGRESVVTAIGNATVTVHLPRPAAPSAIPTVVPAVQTEKYSVTAEIGAGGMGEVLLVRDQDLRREVAMKVMNRKIAGVDEFRLKFVAEAQATSQLEHPGIPPVHDLGVTPDGKLYFTMKLVRGTTLREVLQNLLLGRKDYRQEFTLHRLVTVLERICEALHFAHEKGVLHRDLKPENVMLGDFGEVHIMDWGLASVRGERVDPSDAVVTAETDGGLKTVDGAIKGTVPYMSPEQAMGRLASMDRRSDLWALGCLLYEVLTLHRAFVGEDLLTRVQAGAYPPVRARNPSRPVPEDLALLCERCLELDPEERPASGKEVVLALRAWLDGSAERERRHLEAETRAAAGREAAARYQALKLATFAAGRVADAEEAKFKPWQRVEECLPMLEARESLSQVRKSAVRALGDATRLLEGALLAEEGHAPARAGLASLWMERLADAECMGDREGADHALEMVTHYDGKDLGRVLSGEGSLLLASEPDGAEITLHRYEDRHGILREGDGVPLGRAPVAPRDLPMGSYLCVLRLEGYRDVRYPVHITRNRVWTGSVRMRTEEEIGDGFVLVAGGSFAFGDGREMRTLELPDFAIARFPVTFGEYGQFLASLEAEVGIEAATRHAPRTQDEGLLMAMQDEGQWEPVSDLIGEPLRSEWLGVFGPGFQLRVPVMGVNWHDAVAYCEWKSRATGRNWRLPTEEEREKASRGVDGRQFPWGSLEHASLAKCQDSREGKSQPEPVGSYPTAASVYGMGDAAGNVWDWTDSWYDDHRSLRVLRGGSWNYPAAFLRCAFRFRVVPGLRNTVYGFRCARDLP